jgi:hypothetical protein
LDNAKPKSGDGELAQARAQVKAWQAQLETKAAELAQAKAQYKQAVKELAKLEGKSRGRPAPQNAPRAGRAPKRDPNPRQDPAPAPRPKTEMSAREKAAEALSRFGQRQPPSGTLEQRLERLLREIEQLRREIRGRGQPNSPAPPPKNPGRRPTSEREDS